MKITAGAVLNRLRRRHDTPSGVLDARSVSDGKYSPMILGCNIVLNSTGGTQSPCPNYAKAVRSHSDLVEAVRCMNSYFPVRRSIRPLPIEPAFCIQPESKD